jgi:cephalosporin hydroxylase
MASWGARTGLSLFQHQIRLLRDRASWTAREQGLPAFVLKALRYPLKPFFVPGALKTLQDGHRRVQSVEQLYDFVNGFNYRGITITSWQKKAEIVSLLRLLEKTAPRRIAEIGTANGGTLFMLTQVAAPDATIVSVDLPGGRLGGASSSVRNRYPQWRARLYRGFGRGDQSVHIIRADSHDVSTVEDVRRRLPEGKVDFLFIDGDHSYDGVRRDFELYSPLAAAGGLVAFHDIVPSGPGKHGDPGEVPVFWSEVKNERAVEAEFVEDWDWGSCGIGIIRL